MSLYANDGSINISIVNYSKSGLHAADGSLEVVVSPGTSPVGLYHPSGAYWVTQAADDTLVPLHAADGSLYFHIGASSGAIPVTVVRTLNYTDPGVLTNISVFKVPTIANV